jgi:hypothetical protein
MFLMLKTPEKGAFFEPFLFTSRRLFRMIESI